MAIGNPRGLAVLPALLLAAWFCGGAWVRAASPAGTVYSLESGSARLCLCSNAGKWSVELQLTNGPSVYQQFTPLAVNVVTSDGADAWQATAYGAVEPGAGKSFRCTGRLTSTNGSVFEFSDTYGVADAGGAFQVERSVRVTKAGRGDAGFSTKLTFQRTAPGTMADYDFFMPAIWYRDNAAVTARGLASSLTDDHYWVREDRLPLPLFMLRQKESGTTLSVAHRDPNGGSFAGEDGVDRIIDARLQFGAVGMENKTQPAAGIVFPGNEGERTLIRGGSGPKRWALRAHPVTEGFRQDYRLVVRLTTEPDFPAALKHTWDATHNLFDPAIYRCDLDAIYAQAIGALTRYWTNINGAPGEPFRIPWRTGVITNLLDYNYDMGFVGMQLPNAALLVREGFKTTNVLVRSKGEQMAEWWAKNCLTEAGCPRTWYDPYPQTWRPYTTYLRVACDGMLGLLWAWNQENQHGVPRDNWLETCTRFGDWLLKHQAPDGSIPRGFDHRTNTVADSRGNTTTHAVRYLVELHLATDLSRFREAALKAGEYVYADTFERYSYVGGAVDNPNVPDKEAASMALRAFTALYDLTHEERWLKAAAQTATHYATWIYAWNIPIPAGDPTVVYPLRRQTTGLSLIATSNRACDVYAATDAFEVYRVYLYTGDTNYLNQARMMLYNTKQPLNWDAAHPLPGYGDPGICVESLTLAPPRGHGVEYYLPWQTANALEPMVNLRDAFGSWDINAVERLPLSKRQELNHAFSLNRNYKPR